VRQIVQNSFLNGRTISEEAAQLATARWVHIYMQSDRVTTTALLPSREFVARRLTRLIGKGTLCILPPGGSGPLRVRRGCHDLAASQLELEE
jgi:hypothetical protein